MAEALLNDPEVSVGHQQQNDAGVAERVELGVGNSGACGCPHPPNEVTLSQEVAVFRGEDSGAIPQPLSRMAIEKWQRAFVDVAAETQAMRRRNERGQQLGKKAVTGRLRPPANDLGPGGQGKWDTGR